MKIADARAIQAEAISQDYFFRYTELKLPKDSFPDILNLQLLQERTDPDLDFEGAARSIARSKNPRLRAEREMYGGWGPSQFDALELALETLGIKSGLSAIDAADLVGEDIGFLTLAIVRDAVRVWEDIAPWPVVSEVNVEFSAGCSPDIPQGSTWSQVAEKYERDLRAESMKEARAKV